MKVPPVGARERLEASEYSACTDVPINNRSCIARYRSSFQRLCELYYACTYQMTVPQ